MTALGVTIKGSDAAAREGLSHPLQTGEIVTMFPYREVVNAQLNGGWVVCRNISPLSLQYLAPDLALEGYPVVEEVEIESKIGEGGAGTVYKGWFEFAQSNKMRRKVHIAIKMLKQNKNKNVFTEFQKEVI